MTDFKQFITEALDLARAAPIKWNKTSTHWTGEFQVGSLRYRVELANVMSRCEVAYGVIGDNNRTSFSSTGVNASSGDALKVITTVLRAVQDYVEERSPVKIFFTAYEHDDAAKSRKKLYDRLVKRFSDQIGYDFVITGNKYNLTRQLRQDAEWTEEEVQAAIDLNNLDFPLEVREFRWLKQGKEMVILGMSEDGFDVVVVSAMVRGKRLVVDMDDSFVSDDIDDAYATYEEW